METHGELKLEIIRVGPIDMNCVIAFIDPKAVLVIDPGDDSDMLKAYLSDNDMNVAAYLLTHGHVDHISALADVAEAFPAPMRISKEDEVWAFEEAAALPPLYPPPQRPTGDFRFFSDGDELKYGGIRIEVVGTPGHTPGGVCFLFGDFNVLIAGDTLFKGSVGRTDLPGGNARVLADSIKKLKELPDEITVYPGHGPSTTIGVEKRTNFFMR